MKKIVKIYGLISLLVVLFIACSDNYLNTIPSSSVQKEELFGDVNKAKMAINGIARLMVSQYDNDSGYGQVFCGEGTIKFIFGEYLGENFSRAALTSGNWPRIMNGQMLSDNTQIYSKYIWYYYYTLIGNANEFLANIDHIEVTESEEAVADFLKAQALVYRAYSYTQLVQFYCSRWVDSNNGTKVAKLNEGLVLRTEENRYEKDMPLVSSGEIYTQIYKDLDQAISLFTSSKQTRSNVWEPNINVACAVYARAAITKQDYPKAAEMASKAREGYPLMSNADYFLGFSKDNAEWIWGSYGGDDQTLHYYGFHSYMAYDAGTSVIRSYPVSMSKTLYEKIPETDIRKNLFLYPEDNSYSKTDGRYSSSANFAIKVREEHSTMTSSHRVAAYMSFKYSIAGSRGVGYINHFRSSEMYLIEAEAKYFIGGKELEIQGLMNELIRDSKRDEAYECTATGEDLLKEIKFYRAVELWGEGFDWLDKKRYNEPIVRLSFKDGGNFHSQYAGTIGVSSINNWVYVTPLYESENNNAMSN
ncbi:MAG: RagB/SusD family nutrient uptake outer membrane protein [Bacteroides sp.]|nr:RagB/SusD family nutrient uptake outer membrane protein [Bacteroides sp.]